MATLKGLIPSKEEQRRAVKMVLAAGIAWGLGNLAGEPLPVFAALVPLVAIKRQDDPFSTFSVSVGRMLGVFAGVGLGLVALSAPGGVTYPVALAVIAAGVLLGVVVRVGQDINAQVAASALIMLFVGDSRAVGIGVARLWETAIGAAVTLAVATFVWPPNPVRYLRDQLSDQHGDLRTDLTETIALLDGSGGDADRQLRRVRRHSIAVRDDMTDLDQAEVELRWNALRQQDRPELEELLVRIKLVNRLFRYTRSLARTIADGVVDGRLPTVGAGYPDLVDLGEGVLDAVDATGEEAARKAVDRANGALERFRSKAQGRFATVLLLDLDRLVDDVRAGLLGDLEAVAAGAAAEAVR